MRFNSTIDLISTTKEQNEEGFVVQQETSTQCFCNEWTVSASEKSASGVVGITVDASVEMRRCDYAEQKLAMFNGVKHSIVDVTIQGDFIRLSLQRKIGDNG